MIEVKPSPSVQRAKQMLQDPDRYFTQARTRAARQVQAERAAQRCGICCFGGRSFVSRGFWFAILAGFVVFMVGPGVAHGAGMAPNWALVTGAVAAILAMLGFAWLYDQVNTSRRRARERAAAEAARWDAGNETLLRCWPGVYYDDQTPR